jgi:TolB-like protein/DNA-binding winged helix-turn-helix (wHTH) protein/Tfp pilus assembly protein PilF
MISQADSIVYEFDNFRIDSGKRLLFNGGGEPISLTPKIFDTLLYLVSHNGTVIEKDELMSAIWPDTIVEENNLNKNISVLRHVLGENPGDHRYILTVPGTGYKFVADVRRVANVQSPEALDRDRSETENAPKQGHFRFIFAGVIAAVAIAGLAFGYSYFNNQRQIDSIAVMPFVNESGDAELEYLSDGMTETLIGSLSRLPGLQVKPRSSVFRYKGKNADAATVGSELNVGAVMFGHIVQRGDDLTVHVELVDVRTETNLWSQTYDRKRSNLVALQRELAHDLARGLRLKLTGADEQTLAKRYTDNPEAYQLFLKGQRLVEKITPTDINKGIEYLQQAIEKDPSYALAHATIAKARISLAVGGEAHPSELRRAKAAALTAIEIDDTLAEGHSALGSTVYFYDWKFADAENHFLRALELDSNSAQTHSSYSDLLGRMGRPEEAATHSSRARELEPFSAYFNAVGSAKQGTDAGLERVRFAIELDPDNYFAHMMAAGFYRQKKMYAESIEEYRIAKRLSPHQTWTDAGLAWTLMAMGDRRGTRSILDDMILKSKERFVPPFNIAVVHGLLGEKEEALAMLEKGYEVRDPKMVFLKTDPRLKDLREDPRYQDLVRRVGF